MRYSFLVIVVSAAHVAHAAERPGAFTDAGVAFLKKYCVDCHSGEEPEAGLTLTTFRTNESLIRARSKWTAIVRMVETSVMPPEDADQPVLDERQKFVSLIRNTFAEYDRTAPPDPGRVTMRRLNRREYSNTVRDLLGIDFDPTENFPTDDVGHGFDNIGDVLTLSPLLMERYLDAAETISRRVIVENPPPPSKRYLKGIYLQPGGSTTTDRFRILDPTAEETKVAGPLTASGSYLKFSDDADLYYRATLYAETESDAPVKVALFISGANLDDVSTEEELAPLMGTNRAVLKTAKLLKVFEITARSPEEKQTIEFLIKQNGAIQNAGIAVMQPPEGVKPPVLRIEYLWSEGPLETRPKSQLMLLAASAEKSETEQRVEVISRLLRRAFRRTPSPQEVERFVGFAESMMADGSNWEAAMQKVVQAVLCSPKFLFRVELDDRPTDEKPRPIDSFHLASRLSYFLWSSMPDDELLDLAEKGKLRASLKSQVVRMLSDEKASAFVSSFARQWLQIGRLEQFSPDSKQFPTFSEALRSAMLEETEQFFAAIMREDASILQLLDADFTFVNAPLAKHYGFADTNGNRIGVKPAQPKGQPIPRTGFVRVSLPDKQRGGLLTQASVLTVTSNPTRTSPVKRGKWVLEQILGTPPPPPPANVPELEDEGRRLTGTLREQMEQHRRNPSCAACHTTMDALGFAFENYDAIGAWRAKDGDDDIDASGELPGGRQFSGAADLKSILLERRKEFTRCLAEKMLVYALGRGMEYYDGPTISRIVQRVADDDYHFSSLITAIVESEPFVNRRGMSDEK